MTNPNESLTDPVQTFLKTISKRISSKERERATVPYDDESNIRDILQTEICILHLVRNEFKTIFKEHIKPE